MTHRTYHNLTLAGLVFSVSFISCSTRPEIKRPANIGKPIKVITFDFADQKQNPGSGKLFTQYFSSALSAVSFGKYVQLERRELKKLIDERVLIQSGLMSDENKAAIRQMTGADAVIVGSVTLWEKGGVFSDASVGFNARCIMVGSGEIPWTVSFSDSIARTAGEDRIPEKISEDAALNALNQIQDKLVNVNP